MPEMMVVIIIVVSLMGMGIPAIIKMQKKNAVHSVPNILTAVHNACRENARQFGSTGAIYGFVLRYYPPGSGPDINENDPSNPSDEFASPNLGSTVNPDPVPGQPVWSATQIIPWVRLQSGAYDYQYVPTHPDGLRGRSEVAALIGKQVPWSYISKPPVASATYFFVGHAIPFKASSELLPADGVFFNNSRFISRATDTRQYFNNAPPARDEYGPPANGATLAEVYYNKSKGVESMYFPAAAKPTWRLYVAYQPRTGRVFAARQPWIEDKSALNDYGSPSSLGANANVQALVDQTYSMPNSIMSATAAGTKVVIPLWNRLTKRRDQFFIIHPTGESEVTGVYP